MQLLFLYGPVASGKLTVGRELAERTGWPLFHNHLVVDAVAAVFPFGSEPFVRLREAFWLDVLTEAARDGRSVIFTFAPEPTVASDFPERAAAAVARHGGRTTFVALSLDPDEQDRRLVRPGRAEFGKLRDVDLLRALRPDFDRAFAAMPAPALALDTGVLSPAEAARRIADLAAKES